jgi:site-specific recombinase XerD
MGANRRATRKLPNEILNRDEILALCAAFTKSSLGLRNRALVFVLHRAGLRVSEALALRPADVNLDQGTIQVVHGKGGAGRVCGIDSECCEVVARWLDRRASLGIDRRVAIFCTISHPRPIKPNAVRELLKLARKKSGITKRANPHSFRTTWAAQAALQIPCISHIQQQLGHRNLSSTAAYLASLGGMGAVEAARGIRW